MGISIVGCGRASKIMHREGVGVALGGTGEACGQLPWLARVYLIYTVFTKKCQKRSKGEYPLFLTTFGKISGTRVPPTPDGPSEGQIGLTLPS